MNSNRHNLFNIAQLRHYILDQMRNNLGSSSSWKCDFLPSFVRKPIFLEKGRENKKNISPFRGWIWGKTWKMGEWRGGVESRGGCATVEWRRGEEISLEETERKMWNERVMKRKKRVNLRRTYPWFLRKKGLLDSIFIFFFSVLGLRKREKERKLRMKWWSKVKEKCLNIIATNQRRQ